MRTSKLFAIGAAAVAAAWLASPATAALPPQYQRLAELQAVLENPDVAEALDGLLISRVEYVRPDLYRVRAGRCHVDVAIVGLPTPPGLTGPRRFEARAGKKVCR
jgi:hypothetical protein